MKKIIKYSIGIVVAGVVIYNSLYFQPLNEKLGETKQVAFDAKSFVNKLWKKDLIAAYDSSIDLTSLLAHLKANAELTFEKEGKALGIGNIGYFNVKGEGTVQQVNENNVLLRVGDQIVEIETEFIFGNAVRDASGLIKVNDYGETSDFNNISEAINDKIRKEVIPKFKAEVKKDSKVLFKGALELNKTHIELSQLEVIPVSIQIVP